MTDKKNSGNQHVVNRNNGWAVRGAGNSKDTTVEPTKNQAHQKAKSIAKNKGSDTKVHRKDGKIQGGESYGNDPCPPKDKT